MAGGDIMTVKALVKKYLHFRNKTGYELDNEGKELLRFAHFADRNKHKGPLTIKLALTWAKKTKKKAPVYWENRLGMVRRFAQYLYVYDSNTEIPSKGLLSKKRYHRNSPYIYSDKEIRTLLTAADQFTVPRCGITAKTYRTILGLIICTGIRISEALTLNINDIDLQKGILSINEAKFHKSRVLPIHSSTRKALKRYLKYRKTFNIVPDVNALFLTKKGMPLGYTCIRKAFSFLRKKIGLNDKSRARNPRIHDLRHTFTVKTLLRWYKEGKNINQKIIYLSTYLGHVNIEATYWYLTGVPELLAIASSRFEESCAKKTRRTL